MNQRFLVRSTNWLGDGVLMTPTLRALRHSHPRAHLTVLAVPGVAELLKYLPEVDEILIYDRSGRHRGYRGLLRIAGELQRRGFARGYVMPNSFSSAMLLRLAGIPERIGYATQGRKWLLSHPRILPKGILDQHQIYYYLGILDSTERDGFDPTPRIVVTEEESDWAADRFAREGVTELPVGIVPGATYGTAKRWPLERYIEVARRIVRSGHRVVFFGSPGERALTQEAHQAVGAGSLDLGGRTDVRQFMALLQRCPVVVCNDSGAMHIASALGSRVVVPVGSTDPVTTRPWGKGHILVRHPTACAPCIERDCPMGDHACMERIQTDEVWAAVRRALSLSTSPEPE